jgi:hypothetical protein
MVTAAMALAAPTGALGATGKGDYAAGEGSNQFALGVIGHASFDFVARNGGPGARGRVSAAGDPDGAGPMEPFRAAGRITCLRVEENRASLKWTLDEATGSAAPFVGGGVQSFVEDNGRPGSGAPADRAAVDPPQPPLTFSPLAAICDDPDSRPNLDELDEGDVVVRDATP